MTKRTEITVDTYRLMVVRQRGGPTRAWCEGCRAEVEMIAPEEAAALANVSPRAIYRWIEESRLHFRESTGVLHICANSLTTNYKKRETAPDQAIVKYRKRLS